MGSVGGPEILVVLVLALILLGPERLPAAARTAGKWVAELRKLTGALQAEMEGVVSEVMNPADHAATSEPTTAGASWALDQTPAGSATIACPGTADESVDDMAPASSQPLLPAATPPPAPDPSLN